MRKPIIMGVYKIINKINGRVYVGSTTDLRKRKSTHFSNLKLHDPNSKSRNGRTSNMLQFDYDMYGVENFEFEIIEIIKDKMQLEIREEYWINSLQSNNSRYGYNRRIFVDRNTGLKHSRQSLKRMSISRSGKGTGKRYHSPETVKLKSELCKAQNLKQYHTEESEAKRLKKLREQHCDIPIPEAQKRAISIANTGESNGGAKLTEEKVIAILEMLRDNKISVVKVAEIFDIGTKAIYKLTSGKAWSHVTRPFLDKYGSVLRHPNANSTRNSKLTEDQVIEIIEIINNRSMTQKQIAEKYKVSKSNISDIARGSIWQHIPRTKIVEIKEDNYTNDIHINEELINIILDNQPLTESNNSHNISI